MAPIPADSIVTWLQSLGAWLAVPMQGFSFAGSEYFYLFAAPVLVWLISPSLGLRVGMLLMITTSVNLSLKLAFHQPRPYWVDPGVQPFAIEESFGFPSGHAMNAIVVWGYLALQTKKRWVWAAAAVLIFLIGLSRLYLGVHFTADVIGGWVFGGMLLGFALIVEPRLTGYLRKRSASEKVLLALGASFLMVLVGALIRLTLIGWQIPAEWFPLAERAGGKIDALTITTLFTAAGTFFGLASGGVLLGQRGGMQAHGRPLQLVGRFLVGLVGVAVLYVGPKLVLPAGDTLLAYVLRYGHYALIGLWVTGLAPLIFIRLNLAQRGDVKDVQ